jgi:hypothetical protein
MIKGKQKEKLNQFELEIELLLGSHHFFPRFNL